MSRLGRAHDECEVSNVVRPHVCERLLARATVATRSDGAVNPPCGPIDSIGKIGNRDAPEALRIGGC